MMSSLRESSLASQQPNRKMLYFLAGQCNSLQLLLNDILPYVILIKDAKSLHVDLLQHRLNTTWHLKTSQLKIAISLFKF